MYDYTGTILYSAKTLNSRKNGILKYFKCLNFDGENLIVEPLTHLPMDMAFADKKTNKKSWNIHNLDILSEKYKIEFRGK